MKKNAFYAQSGGVTSVINASACGVIEAARKHKDKINKGERVLTLKCKHFFHKECWYETIAQHVNSNVGDIMNCPTCRKTYYIHEII